MSGQQERFLSWDTYGVNAPSRRTWLESIVKNAGEFTDWWTKARIIQLAHPDPDHRVSDTYRGLSSTPAIETVVRSLCGDLAAYPDFDSKVNQVYVNEVLDSWETGEVFQEIGRNFEVYEHCHFKNTFLITSTAPVSLNVDRQLPSDTVFRPLFNIDEFAQIIWKRKIQRLALRTHGYSNPASSFYKRFSEEAAELNEFQPEAGQLQPNNFYIGYYWPSERPLISSGLWRDYFASPGIIAKFLLSMVILAVVATALYSLIPQAFWQLLNVLAMSSWQVFLVILILWLAAFLLLRVVVYQRDRYRAVHYGAPDLAEFFWRLDRALTNLGAKKFEDSLIRVTLIGHSMGALLLVNVLRILSDMFGKDDQAQRRLSSSLRGGQIGDNFVLIQLVLASPDIPLEFIREGRNNYVRSAMNRCERIYLFSSDRDIVLRYLATLGNWFTEPSLEMAGLRLGNVYLRRNHQGGEPYERLVRIMLRSVGAVKAISARDLFSKFNYLDCSEMNSDQGFGGVNGVPFRLNALNGLLIDALNTVIYLVFSGNRVDVHGGYFQPDTCSFKIIKFLITADELDVDTVNEAISGMIQNTPIRFLSS